METLNALLTRVSNPHLTDPHPSLNQMDIVYKAAFRAPDHAWLRPWRFIEVTGMGRKKLGDAFINSARKNGQIDEELKKNFSLMPFRAPMIIIICVEINDRPNVPAIEQIQSTAAATQNILLALHDMGFAAFWRTGAFASHSNAFIAEELSLPLNNQVLGYIYLGTPKAKGKVVPSLTKSEFVTIWN